MISEIKQYNFSEACKKVVGVERERLKIGTLCEKTLHAVLKNYFDPYGQSQEIKIGSYYADIVGENGIVEIQTGNFGKLRDKMECFLKACDVTVAYPIPFRKRLYWVDKNTGEVNGGRLSPKTGSFYEIFPEIYRIREFLNHPGLKMHLMLVNIDEHKYLDGYGKNKKTKASRCDKIPTELAGEILIANKYDYLKILPENLPDEFTTKDLSEKAHIDLNLAQYTLYVLNSIELVERIGKKGNSHIYRSK